MSMTVSDCSTLDVLDSEVTAAFLTYPALKISEIGIGMKGQRDSWAC